MWRSEVAQMRFGLGSSLGALLLACSIFCNYVYEAVNTEPATLHAVNAAQSANVAEQAALVARRVAAHTEDVAHDTATALRYTQDALKRAHASSDDIAEVGRQADELDEEAGITGAGGIKRRDMKEGSSHASGNSHSSQSSRSSQSRRGEGSGGLASGSASSSASSSASNSGRGSNEERGGSGHGASNSGRGSLEGRGGSGHGDGPSGDTDGSGVEHSLDIDGAISPYPNGVEPFGQEAPAKEMTEESVKQSDGMIKQIEHTQGVESKRAVYRALTKLRGATIASYDGMAKSHLKNVDHYNKKHKWRDEHPMRHLAEEEADTEVWAFPMKKSKAAAKKPPAGNGNTPASPAPAAAQ